MKGRVCVVVALAFLVCMVTGEKSHCEYETCSKCISDASCIWCSNQNITSVASVSTGVTLPQCINKDSPDKDEFQEACKNAIYDPPTEVEEEQPASGTMFTPQRVKLKMRAGESTKISFKYEHQAKYPVDLYCLMDGSTSMAKFKEQLSEVTTELVTGLMDITQNVNLGFGMFVDKPTLPYTDLNSLAACAECTQTYSFKNILPLTSDQNIFQEKVLSSPVSTNTDQPEGILEALVQVASCGSKVGWRTEALKVAVVFTDAAFHSAGHGRLAGIVQPNDRTCHLDTNGDYTHSLSQDYPSIGELSKVLKDNNLTTVFAATNDQVSLYQMLSSLLDKSFCSDMDASSNIVDLIVGPVKETVQTITLKPQVSMPEVTVDVYTRCKSSAEQKGDTCREMLIGDTAEFTLDIKIEKCPARDQQNVTLNFELVGHSQNFYLDLEMLCECRCEEKGKDFIPNADICMGQGDLRCGACECHSGFLGKNCQCKEGDMNIPDTDEKNCIPPNATETVVCSGQGKCECGQCVCNKRPDPAEVIEGRYCQCTNFHKDCRGNNGEICSGHGNCDCNECDCDEGWKGQNCSCSTDIGNCIDPDGEVCSGHGNCTCNRCECQADYEGKHCESCKFCDEKCEEHKPCVECLVFKTGPYRAACEDQCSSYTITIISDMTKNYGHLCSRTDEDGCRFFYQVKENVTVTHVWAQDSKECPKVINPWVIVGGVLAGVVLVGLMLLIAWKVFTTIKDRKEYANFLTEKKAAAWTDNVSPLYKPAKSEFRNPLFGASN